MRLFKCSGTAVRDCLLSMTKEERLRALFGLLKYLKKERLRYIILSRGRGRHWYGWAKLGEDGKPILPEGIKQRKEMMTSAD